MRSLYACVDSSGSLFGIKRRANVGCRRINFAVCQTGHFAERSRPACFRCVQRDGGSRHIADSRRSVHRRTAPSADLRLANARKLLSDSGSVGHFISGAFLTKRMWRGWGTLATLSYVQGATLAMPSQRAAGCPQQQRNRHQPRCALARGETGAAQLDRSFLRRLSPTK